MRNRVAYAACFVLVLILGGLAGAQAREAASEPGPGLVLPYLLPSGMHCTINPGFEWRLQYEDNVANAVRNETSDFSSRYKPSLEISVAEQRFSLSARTELDIIEFFDETYLNAVDQGHTLDLSFDFNERTRFFCTGAYTVSTDPDRFFEVDDLSGIGDFTVARTKQKTKSGSLGLTRGLSPRSEMTAMTMWSSFDTGSASDSDMYNAQVQYLYRLEPRTELSLAGTYSKFDFAFDEDLSAQDQDFYEDLVGGGDLELSFGSRYKTETYAATAGVDHVLSRDFRISASLGWRYTETDSTPGNGDTGPEPLFVIKRRNSAPAQRSGSTSGDGFIYDLSLEKDFARTRFRLSANQNVGTNPDSGESYEATRVLCSVAHTFTGKLSGSATFLFRHNDSDASDEFASETDRDVYVVSALLSYALRRWINVSAGYLFSRNENNLQRRQIDRTTVFSMITLKPLRPMVIW